MSVLWTSELGRAMSLGWAGLDWTGWRPGCTGRTERCGCGAVLGFDGCGCGLNWGCGCVDMGVGCGMWYVGCGVWDVVCGVWD